MQAGDLKIPAILFSFDFLRKIKDKSFFFLQYKMVLFCVHITMKNNVKMFAGRFPEAQNIPS